MTTGPKRSKTSPQNVTSPVKEPNTNQNLKEPNQNWSLANRAIVAETPGGPYQTISERGQRRVVPPADWTGDPPRGTELFVSKLPRDITESELIPTFEKYGRIYEMRLMMETSDANKGFAFVKYCTKSDSEMAVAALNNYEVKPNKRLSVTRSVDNNRIFIGNIPKCYSEHDVFNQMKNVSQGVRRVILYPSVNDRSKNRGYGFVEFESHQLASAARSRHKANPIVWMSHELKVDWAEPELEVDDETMKKYCMMHEYSATMKYKKYKTSAGGCILADMQVASEWTQEPECYHDDPEEGANDPTANDSALKEAIQKLQTEMDCSIVHTKWHRKYGPPNFWKGCPPTRGSEVFVGKIPRDLYEDELIPVLQKAGMVYEVRLMMESSGRNRGFAYVKYSSRSEAELAIESLNNFEIRPRQHLGIMKSVDNNRLFVGGIPKNRTRKELEDEMNRMTEGVLDVILYSDVNDKTKNRGFAFIEYESHASASTARQKLLKNPPLLWGCSQVKVDWAEPEREVDEQTMKKVRILYVRNLASTTTEQSLKDLLSTLGGTIERVKKMKDYAFVHFSTREEAEEAKEKFQGHNLDGCKIDINWSKPVTNREEYQQRKAASKAMVSGFGANNAIATVLGIPSHETLRVRTAAGAQGYSARPYPARPRSENMLSSFQAMPNSMQVPNPYAFFRNSIEQIPIMYATDQISVEDVAAVGNAPTEICHYASPVQRFQHWITPPALNIMSPQVQNSWATQPYIPQPMTTPATPGMVQYIVPQGIVVDGNPYGAYGYPTQVFTGPMISLMPNIGGSNMSIDQA